MKKRLTALVLALTLCLLLPACGGSGSSTSAPADSSTSAPADSSTSAPADSSWNVTRPEGLPADFPSQEITYIFKQGGGEALAKSMDIPFLGRIPLEPIVGEASDAGRPFVVTNPESASAKAFAAIVDAIAAQDK